MLPFGKPSVDPNESPFPNRTRRAGSATGNRRSISAFITLKIAVLAPIPRARVRMAMQVMTGFFSNWRKANFKSFITQRHHRIDSRRAASGEIAGAGGHREHQNSRSANAGGVGRGQSEKQAGN